MSLSVMAIRRKVITLQPGVAPLRPKEAALHVHRSQLLRAIVIDRSW
jgi:hypothetical protein